MELALLVWLLALPLLALAFGADSRPLDRDPRGWWPAGLREGRPEVEAAGGHRPPPVVLVHHLGLLLTRLFLRTELVATQP